MVKFLCALKSTASELERAMGAPTTLWTLLILFYNNIKQIKNNN